VLAIPNEMPGVAERYGLSHADVEATAWAIDACGRAFSGAASINRVLLELKFPWNIVGRSYGSVLLRNLEDAVYRVLAANRGRFSRWGVAPEWQEDEHRRT
jgi:predicted DCC family thiol-disulfide oxidoreductase YuxK